MKAVLIYIARDIRYACVECGRVLTMDATGGTLCHDQFERTFFGSLDKTKPSTCRFSGQEFEVPLIELKRVK